MKKNGNQCCLFKEWHKLLFVMRLSIVLMLIGIMHVTATVNSQTRVSVKASNQKVGEVLKQIESESGIRFFYKEEHVDANRAISISAKDETIEEVLSEIFEGTSVEYRFFGNELILLSTSEDSANSTVHYQAQQREVKGIVRDKNGEPLPGVNVYEKGNPTHGVITGIDGGYSINVGSSDVILIFSFIGYEDQELNTAGRQEINVTLIEEFTDLNEVVVIGYGTKAKATVTGAVSTVSSDVLKDQPQPSVVNSLQGIVPGLQITRGGGSIGDEGQGIQLRGVTSKSDPGVLVIIDGIPQSFTSALGLSNLNPADVESMTVLKDAQAAIYGARAAGGVILITTKKGKKGKPQFNYTNNFALRVPGKTPDKVNLNQMIEMSVDAWESDGQTTHAWSKLAENYPYDLSSGEVLIGQGPFPDTPDIIATDFDWWDYIFGNALTQKHDFSVSGAGDKSNYFLSVGYLKEESMLNYGENQHKKYFTRAKYDYQVTDWLNIGTNWSLEKKELIRPYELESTDWGRFYWTMENTYSSQVPFNPAGNTYGWGGGDFRTPRAWLEKNGDEKIENYRIRPTFEFTMTPLEGLQIKGQYSLFIDFYDVAWQKKHFKVYSWENNFLSQNIRPEDNAAGSKYHKHTQQVVNLYANYSKKINNHNFDLMVGGAHEETWRRGFEASIMNLITPTLPVMNIGDPDTRWIQEFANDWAIKSFFSRLSYNYAGRYFVEATMRRDGSSKFADGHRWGTYPGVSGGWILTEENFMGNVKKYVEYLKLRASYGELGNQANVGLYDHFATIGTGNVYPFGSYASPSRSPAAWVNGMTSLTRTWETIKTKNIGIDAYFLNNRLGVTADYFIKNTEGMLVGREYPKVLGAEPPKVNGGSLEVKGYELSVNWRDKINDFNYSIQFNLSDNKAKVTSLEDTQVPWHGRNDFVEGYAPGTYFLFQYGGKIQDEATLERYKQIEGVPGNLRVGDIMVNDLDGDGVLEKRLYDPGNPEESGDLIPVVNDNIRYQFSSVITCGYRNFDFSATLQGVGKWMVFDNALPLGGGWWKMPELRYYNKTWTPDNIDSKYPRLTADGGIGGWNYQQTDAGYKLYDNKYLRLKSITLGYTLPKNLVQKVGIGNCRVYFSGFDLFELQNIPKHSDPERPFVAMFTPFARTFSMGLDLTF